jgi:hypothetical protein
MQGSQTRGTSYLVSWFLSHQSSSSSNIQHSPNNTKPASAPLPNKQTRRTSPPNSTETSQTSNMTTEAEPPVVDETSISPIRSHERRNSLEKHLQHRPEAQDLKNRHILLATSTAPYVFLFHHITPLLDRLAPAYTAEVPTKLTHYIGPSKPKPSS